MKHPSSRASLAPLLFLLLAAGVAAQTPVPIGPIPGPVQGLTPNQIKGWPGYGRVPTHQAISNVRAQDLNQIRWSTPVDLQPQYSGGDLFIHYGSPLVARHGTVVVTVKTGVSGGFRVEGHAPSNGALIWSQNTDYVLPPHNWTPSMGSTLTPANKLVTPGAGGTVYVRDDPEAAGSAIHHLAFYGLASYLANQSTYDANVTISTPITSDAQGNLYFGFLVLGATPTSLVSGLARISSAGVGSWVSAATAAGDGSIQQVVYNCAPALSRDGQSLYFAVSDEVNPGFGFGYLVRLNSTTLALQSKVRLRDPSTNDAYLPDDGTASPTVGPDGDVYYGVLENPFPYNNDRGWLLHFNSTLSVTKIPGAFGWDDTASVVPAAAVPSYGGSSSYLLLTKYNNYAGLGDGVNKLAVVDPSTSMVDPITGNTVMNDVLTVVGPTPDADWTGTYPNAVREWCINTAAVDPLGRCALVNNEDGKLYRWDFVSNTLTQTITLTAGVGEAYTPTILGNDGTVYAINDATLFAVGN